MQHDLTHDDPTDAIILMEFDCPIESLLYDILQRIKTHGSVILKGQSITLQDLSSLRALLSANGYHSFFELGNSGCPCAIYVAAHPKATYAEMLERGDDDYEAADVEKRKQLFDRVCREIKTAGIAEEIDLVTAAIRTDEGYRLSWVANLAQAFVAAGTEHYTAQEGAARFLDTFAGVDARLDDSFQTRPTINPPSDTTE